MSNDMENNTLIKVGGRIRVRREACNLNLHELARLCGISASALSLIETGKRDLRVTSLYRITEALRVRAGELLDGGDPDPANVSVSQGEGYDLGDYT